MGTQGTTSHQPVNDVFDVVMYTVFSPSFVRLDMKRHLEQYNANHGNQVLLFTLHLFYLDMHYSRL